jgi:predicted glycosyltransferase
MRSGRYLLVSHDGFGLGHTRRNTRIAEALRQFDPGAETTILTGVSSRHPWLDERGHTVVRVPELVKNRSGDYRNQFLSPEEALSIRSSMLVDAIARVQPDAVVVDRHPFGLAGEWRAGLTAARDFGSAIIVGLRDVIDEPSVVRAELCGDRWAGAAQLIDEVFVYGGPVICDHMREYNLSIEPVYCGWVVDALVPAKVSFDPGLLVVAAGGGGDGAIVTEMGCGLASSASITRAIFVMGPHGADRVDALRQRVHEQNQDIRIDVRPSVSDCVSLFAQAGVVLQMAGYNSTIESLAVGNRPILVPRRAPRREQAIRATRLASLGLADVVDFDAPPDEVAWLLARPRRLSAHALSDVGITLNGASVAAQRIMSLVGAAA